MVRCMFGKVRVLDGGGSVYLPGQVLGKLASERLNKELKTSGKRPIQSEQIILGITRASLQTNSFLSAASFQETTRVLIEAATKGLVDPLRGLKENVIIGKLIPAGTGFDEYLKGQSGLEGEVEHPEDAETLENAKEDMAAADEASPAESIEGEVSEDSAALPATESATEAIEQK